MQQIQKRNEEAAFAQSAQSQGARYRCSSLSEKADFNEGQAEQLIYFFSTVQTIDQHFINTFLELLFFFVVLKLILQVFSSSSFKNELLELNFKPRINFFFFFFWLIRQKQLHEKMRGQSCSLNTLSTVSDVPPRGGAPLLVRIWNSSKQPAQPSPVLGSFPCQSIRGQEKVNHRAGRQSTCGALDAFLLHICSCVIPSLRSTKNLVLQDKKRQDGGRAEQQATCIGRVLLLGFKNMTPISKSSPYVILTC